MKSKPTQSEETKSHLDRMLGAIAELGVTPKWAEDTRSLAGMTSNPSAKRLLLEVAEIQDQMAAGSKPANG